METKAEIKIKGFELLKKTANKTGKNSTSCLVYLPLSWEGKKIAIIRTE